METSTKNTVSPPHSTAKATEDPLRLREVITIESYHILQDKLRIYIIVTLSLLWLSAQLRRYVARDLNAGCWYGWDALALPAVAFLCRQKQLAIACIFTSAYFVWTRLPGSPFNDLHLPSFTTFLETSSSQHSDGTANHVAANTTDIQEDTPACLVCWSTDPKPLTLPCTHPICRECLYTMHAAHQTHCPLCRLPLFHANSSLRCLAHKAAVTALAARLTATALYHLLQLWHGQYRAVAKAAVTYFPQLYCFRTLHIVILTQGVEWWRFGLFDYLLPLPVPEGRVWKSVWPAVGFAVLFSMGVVGTLGKIGRLDLVVWRVVRPGGFEGFFAG
ncbi:hypothetical protein WHR41_01809 [Cladosporium halotolerans]|uniref:RING-type domain-containing protein n=1 Tax=Cladosporium halotolerans TaxID=1052096 RepID=A0AB34L186_9PEZI